jgi:pilus assembly protein CpaB
MFAVLAAIVVGLVGVVAVLVYASGADSRAVAGQRVETVYMAQSLVPSGTTASEAVTKGLIVPTQVAAVGVPAGALSKVDANNGKLVALTDIAAGDFVLASRFGTTPTGDKAIQVPEGQVALSVALSGPAQVGTFLTPGSHVVIYDTYVPDAAPAAGASAVKQTRVLIDDALVIAVGSTSLTPVGGQGAAASSQTQTSATGALVTVALPPNTAAKLVHGIQTGSLYAALRGTGTTADPGQIVTDSTLFNP